jgi:hypothetical protein
MMKQDMQTTNSPPIPPSSKLTKPLKTPDLDELVQSTAGVTLVEAEDDEDDDGDEGAEEDKEDEGYLAYQRVSSRTLLQISLIRIHCCFVFCVVFV